MTAHTLRQDNQQVFCELVRSINHIPEYGLVDQKQMRIITATHSPILLDSKDTYVIDLDKYINKNVIPMDMPPPNQSTIN